MMLRMIHILGGKVGYLIQMTHNLIQIHHWILEHSGDCTEKAYSLAESENRLYSSTMVVGSFSESGVSACKRHCSHCYCSLESQSGLGWTEG